MFPRCTYILLISILVACGDAKPGELPDAATSSDAPTSADAALAPDAPTDGAAPSMHDPTGGITMPGEHGGSGCPDTDESMFTLPLGAVSSHAFSGVVTGAEGHGTYYVRGTGNQELFGTVPTDTAGNYQIEVPLFCGAQLVKLRWTNAACSYTLVYDVTTDTCTTPDIRITMNWDELGADWELHLVKPGGKINDNATDCTWTSCIGASPDWGVQGDATDDPTKDVDNTGAFGPENILLSKPESGTYTVMVEHWGQGDPMSDGTVILNVANQPIHVLRMTDLAPMRVWTAATLTYPGAVVAPSTAVHDCSANWSGGCRDSIP